MRHAHQIYTNPGPEFGGRGLAVAVGLGLALGAYYVWKKGQTEQVAAAAGPAPSGVDPALWQMVIDASVSTGVPPQILGGLIATESSWHVPNSPENQAKCGVPCANSSCAAGLTQMKQAAVEDVGGSWSGICDPANAILWGAKYLKKWYDKFGSWDQAISAYHIGPGAVASGKTDTSNYSATLNKYASRYASAASGLGRPSLFMRRYA